MLATAAVDEPEAVVLFCWLPGARLPLAMPIEPFWLDASHLTQDKQPAHQHLDQQLEGAAELVRPALDTT